MSPAPRPAPLAGVRVVELAQFISGPYPGQLLGQWGAEVIKVESPRGDPFRTWDGNHYGAPYQAYNQGKKSVVLDIKDEVCREAVRELFKGADVVIENFRPGVLERHGLGADESRLRNQGLVYCSITGFGDSGPLRDGPGFDTIAQARSGLLSLLIDPDNPTLRGPALTDCVTGLIAALGIVSALYEREQTGNGCRVEASLLEGGLALLAEAVSVPESNGMRARAAQAFVLRCADDTMIVVHLSSPQKFWERFLEAVEEQALTSDERFMTLEGRRKYYDELTAELQRIFSKRTRDEWLTRLESLDVPSAPVLGVTEALAQPQAVHLGLIRPADPNVEGSVQTVRHPPRFSGVLPEVANAPVFGEHTREVLMSVGLSSASIEELTGRGAAFTHAPQPESKQEEA
jgi:crotonobetainyl-CoA:carnitine CoA-transferase CaiB-like acyl-CoA transferase